MVFIDIIIIIHSRHRNEVHVCIPTSNNPSIDQVNQRTQVYTRQMLAPNKRRQEAFSINIPENNIAYSTTFPDPTTSALIPLESRSIISPITAPADPPVVDLTTVTAPARLPLDIHSRIALIPPGSPIRATVAASLSGHRSRAPHVRGGGAGIVERTA
ncbi:hypothetical protein K431DRAFT_96884 [Polychaeton citri CBS 116435]|uniref:Uncharacterized protein n=1 Tax=Polychaeton citri CBS 116435 TaxID=1314669 RepID=A0A9P4Q685_9PEZI|nr:hypothetical protein K431DRAFT_96884 [Polychaeton citri CBS 116435]